MYIFYKGEVKVKVKVNLSLYLTKHHAMKTYCGSGGIAPRILNLGSRWKRVVSFTPRPLYFMLRALGTHWIGGWMSPRAGLDTMANKKSVPLKVIEPRSSSP
jgi:hypothetical protein